MELMKRSALAIVSRRCLRSPLQRVVRNSSVACRRTPTVTSHWGLCNVTNKMPSFFQKLLPCVSTLPIVVRLVSAVVATMFRRPFTYWFNRQASRDKTAEGLHMKTVDCNWMKETNESDHHTLEYENSLLVLRRGQTFKVKVTFQRPFNEEADKVFVEFAIGSNPLLVNDTKIRVSLSEALDPNKWSMVLEDTDENSVTVKISIPPNAIVGKYKTAVEFESKLEDGTTARSRDKEPDMIVLFNPWCKDDQVYLEDDDQREEYVVSDTGSIYRGSTRRISPKAWNFGQYEDNILDCAILLLNKDKRTTANKGKWLPKRRDPIWVSRALSATVNEILIGNWSGDYEGGHSPTSWNGSVRILQKYWQTKHPVKFGQCWVFSGVMTTLLRSLGIPTRSVTNFASAHDTEGSMTIDNYYDEEGDEIELGGDSVWNFHVWNESWMKRPDLPPGYDGWQAVDATPQEISLGLYQTGPAPLTAIKKGEVYLGYETPFVFAEVNADRVSWIVKKEDGSNFTIERLGRRYPSSVGKYLSTKKVGVDEREDVTHLYKHPEGSEEERAAFKLAYGFGSQPEYQKGFLALQDEDAAGGIDMSFTTTPGDAELYNGDDFTVAITMKNTSSEERIVDLTSSMHSILYTGTKKSFIKRNKFPEVKLAANGSVTKEFKVTFNEYTGKLVDHAAVKLIALAAVKATGKTYSEDFEFRLDNRKDMVEISVEGDPLKVGKKGMITVKFKNPLPIKLSHVTVTLEGPGVTAPIPHKVPNQIMPEEDVDVTFNVTPKRSGRRRVMVDIDTRQIQDIKGSTYLDVATA